MIASYKIIRNVGIALLILVLLIPVPSLALNPEEVSYKNETMIKKYTAGDREGAYRIFLELEALGIVGFKDFFIPQTDAEINSFQAALRNQNIHKSTDEIKSYSKEMDGLNRNMFDRYMQQDAQGVLAAAQEMNALGTRFLQTGSSSQPQDTSPETGSSLPGLSSNVPTQEQDGPVISSAPPATDEEIAQWEKMLEEGLDDSNYLETTQKVLNYTKTGLKLSGKLAKYPLVGMFFDAVNVPFDSLENYRMGDNVFKAFAKSLSGNTLHAVTNLVFGPVVLLRNAADYILDIPEEERIWVTDWRDFTVGVNNILWDNGMNGTFGQGVGREEMNRRTSLRHYPNPN
jgi:hypothetical protein